MPPDSGHGLSSAAAAKRLDCNVVLCTAALYDFSGRCRHILTRQMMSGILFRLIHHLFDNLAGTQVRTSPFSLLPLLCEDLTTDHPPWGRIVSAPLRPVPVFAPQRCLFAQTPGKPVSPWLQSIPTILAHNPGPALLDSAVPKQHHGHTTGSDPVSPGFLPARPAGDLDGYGAPVR